MLAPYPGGAPTSAPTYQGRNYVAVIPGLPRRTVAGARRRGDPIWPSGLEVCQWRRQQCAILSAMVVLGLTVVEWVTVVGFVITVLGFAATLSALRFAWTQLRRTQTSADAAKTAGEAVRDQLQDVQLAWLLPRLQETEHALEHARQARDAESAGLLLSQWRRIAPMAEALLDRTPSAPPGLAKEVRTTAALAVSAQRSISDGDDVNDALRVVLPQIGSCTYNIGVCVAHLSLSLRPGEYE